MNLYSHLTFAICISYLVLGIYVLYRDNKAALNQIFFMMNILFSIWSFGALFFYYIDSIEACWFWYKVILFGQCFYVPFVVCFFLALTKNFSLLKKWWLHVFLYLPPMIVFYKFCLGDPLFIKDFLIISPGHIRINFQFNFWFFFHLLFQIGYSLFALGILIPWKRSLKYPLEKKQAWTIIFSSTVTFLSAATVGIILPIFFHIDTVPLAPAASIPGAIGLLYSIVKYKLLVLTPSLAAESILDTMVDSVILANPELIINTVNKETCKLLEYEEKELRGKDLKFIFNDDTFSKLKFMELLKKGPIRNHEMHCLSKSGKTIPIVFSASEHRDNRNNLLGIVIISRDITERKNTEEQLKNLAHHDFLTGLPNRLLFSDRLKQAVSRSRRFNNITAVLLLDVDRFKEVNDVFGHSIGDALLVEIAKRLKSSIRETDTIARLGGDEFVFIINDLHSKDNVKEIAAKICRSFSNTFTIDSHELHITPSIGISLYPYDGDNAEILVKNADLAMYYAKSQGKNNFQFYKPSLGISSIKKLEIENNLRKAIERKEFVVFYQPMVDVLTGKIISIEALVRWEHPEQGLIEPSKFIPAAEETRLIVQIGELVLHEACRQCIRWIEQGLSPAPVSVNLSACQFKQKDLIEKILQILNETGLEPHFLELEITESTAMTDVEHTVAILRNISKYGITITIDDFGTGYSSLYYLSKFPIRTIKIDRQFIRNITKNANDAAIVTAIFAMANTMNIRVIAEGIETSEQLEFLRSLKWKFIGSLICDGAQGYYFSKPVPAENFLNLLQQQKNTGGILPNHNEKR